MAARTISIDWGSFLGQAWPMLAAYIAGLIVSIVMMGRHRTPAVLALISMVLMIAAMFAPVFYNQLIDLNRSSESIRESHLVFGMITNVLRAVGMGLLIWAVFAGRRREEQPGYGFGVVPQQYPTGY